MKKILKRTGIILLSIIFVLILVAVSLFWNEIRSLSSIKKVDDYGGWYEGEDRLQWSVVYNLSSLSGVIFADRNTDNLIEFALKLFLSRLRLNK